METNQVRLNTTATAGLAKRQLQFQLTYCEFMTLYALLADATSRHSPEYDMYDKLLHNIMVGIYKKLFIQGSELKDGYTIELSSIECIAFWLYWTDHPYTEATISGKVLDRMNKIILVMFNP